MRLRKLGILVALVLFVSVPLAAQETTGRVGGRVVDPQSLAIPGVTVTATGPQGAKSTTTDAAGRFTIPFLTPGTYVVRAELQGFKSVEEKDVNVSLGQTTEVALKLEVGGVAETVQVTGTVSLVDTTSTTIGSVLATDDLSKIPVGRDSPTCCTWRPV